MSIGNNHREARGADRGSHRVRQPVGGQPGSSRAETFSRKVQTIFQDPYRTLDPRHTVLQAVAEPLLYHGITSRAEQAERLAEMLALVGLKPVMRTWRGIHTNCRGVNGSVWRLLAG